MKVLKVKNILVTQGDYRLDSSFHLSEGVVAGETMNNSPFEIKKLSDITSDIYNGARFKRYYVRENGIPFMGSSDMLKSNFSNLKLLSHKYTKNINSLKLKKNWILISCSGTIGNTVFTNEDFDGKTASQHVMRVIPNKQIKEGYLYAYLSSKYGYSLLTQGTYGAVIQHIEPHHITNLPVPILPKEKQEEIHNLIVEASNLRVEANRLLEETIVYFEDYYNIEEKETIFKVNIKDIINGNKYTKEHRLESDFYQPSTQKLITQIKKENWEYLEDLSIEIKRSGLRERKFVKNGIKLLTGQNLNMSKLSGLKMLSKKFTRNIEKNTTKNFDILVSVQGTIGKIEYVYDNMYKNVFASEQLTKIYVDQNKIHPGFVFAFLKSKIGKQQLLKYKTGSVIEWVKENNIGSVIIPIPDDKGNKVGGIINKLTLMQENAFNKENQAITLIEKEIESWQK